MSTVSSLDHVGLLFAPEAVLWRKDGSQLARKFLGQQITGQTNIRIDRRAIHDDGKATTVKQAGFFRQQPFKSDAK
jgi:hypothetical protein